MRSKTNLLVRAKHVNKEAATTITPIIGSTNERAIEREI